MLTKRKIGSMPHFALWSGLRANLEYMAEMGCIRLAENQFSSMSCFLVYSQRYCTSLAQRVSLNYNVVRAARRHAPYDVICYWGPANRNVGDVGLRIVRNRWLNGHTLRTFPENMETKLLQWFLLLNSYGFYVKKRRVNFHVYVISNVTYVIYLRYVKVAIASNAYTAHVLIMMSSPLRLPS